MLRLTQHFQGMIALN